MSQQPLVDHELRQALRDFQASLTPEQKNKLSIQTAKLDTATVLAFTAHLDAENAKQHRRCISSRVTTFLDSVERFSGVVDTFVSSNPTIAALVWGSVRFTLLAAASVSSYFDKLSLLLMDLRNHCPRFLEYQSLFSGSKGLQTALCNYYASVVTLCQKTLEISERTATSHFAMALVRPYEKEFGDIQDRLKQQCREVEAEIKLASRIAAKREQDLQAKERGRMQRFRNVDSESKRQIAEARFATKRQHLLEKLTKHSHITAFKQAKKRRLGQTCLWFVNSDEFKRWQRDVDSSLFLCYGKMGCGKTVLSAHVVDTLLCDPACASRSTAFFYCQFENAASMTARVILGSIARQLLSGISMTPDMASQLEVQFEQGDIDIEDLASLIIKLLVKRCGTIVIDALDECDKREQISVLKALKSVMITASQGVKLFMTGRPDIRSSIDRFFKNYRLKSMGISEVNEDIERYISDALQEREDEGRLELSDSAIREEIKSSLVNGARGMILWVYFQIEEICQQSSNSEIRRTLETLPRDLPETYERALGKITCSPSLASIKKELKWIAAARRPLSAAELREAIAIEVDQNCRDVTTYINNPELLVSWCAGLTFRDEEEDTIHFAHPSVRDFLLATKPAILAAKFPEVHFEYVDANFDIGKACVTYLNFSDFETQLARVPKASVPHADEILNASLRAGLSSGVARSWVKLGSRLRSRGAKSFNILEGLKTASGIAEANSIKQLQESCPLLGYASEHWLYHVSDLSPSEAHVWNQCRRLLVTKSSIASTPWSQRQWDVHDPVILRWILKRSHQLLLEHFLSTFPCPLDRESQVILQKKIFLLPNTQMLELLLRHSAMERATLEHILVTAADLGNTEIVSLLLLSGVNVNSEQNGDLDDEDRSVTVSDAESDLVEQIYKLYGIGRFNPMGLQGTALKMAARRGHAEITELLLAAGAEVDEASSSSRRTALEIAAENGYSTVVKLLVAAGANVNAAAYGRTALQEASRSNSTAMVETLLDAKANVNAQTSGTYGLSALQFAVLGGHNHIVKRLLTAGAEVNDRGSIDKSPLWLAVDGNQFQIIEQLLAAGADVNASPQMRNSFTTLQLAVKRGNIGFVKHLLAAGADVNDRESTHPTPLQIAAEGDSVELVRELLAAGADVNALPSDEGRTALQAAAEQGRIEIVERLLTAGADVNALPSGYRGRTALQAAAGGGRIEIVERLLTAGADVNALPSEDDGWTTLQAAAEQGRIEIVERLLTAGADVNALPSEDNGRTALQAAAEQGRIEIVERLLAAGADVDALPSEYRGRTALQAAVGEGRIEIVERLLAAGADVNALPSNNGRTALQAAAEQGRIEIIERLLTAGADVNALPSEDNGRTALQAAAEQGRIEIVERLLTAGADVNALPSRYGSRTALQAAAGEGRIEIVERLLAAGADVNALPSDDGRTALQAAAEQGRIEIVERLLTAGADVNALPSGYRGRTALQAAAGEGRIEIVERLLTAGADVDALPSEDNGRTALQAAAEQGRIEIVERLLTAGADVNALPSEYDGRTALEAAAGEGRIEIVERLLTAGADVNALPSGYRGRTALQAAAGEGRIEIVERLLAAGADVNALPSEYRGRTALQAAAGEGRIEIFERLLAAGADVDALPSEYRGRTALQAAAGEGRIEIVERLLAAGADVNASPSRYGGWTALQAAAENGHLEILERLLAGGAEVNAPPSAMGGLTAMEMAARYNHVGAVKVLLEADANVPDTSDDEDRHKEALALAVENDHNEVADLLREAHHARRLARKTSEKLE